MQQDAIIIGGGFAGLSAAYILGRARRHVTIIDSGTPRNRFAAHAHGVLGHDGKSGAAILAEARAQLSAYPTVTFLRGEADSAEGTLDDFDVRTDSGEVVATRRILLASGVEDRLPDIPGLQERWGQTALHCPYCHGYEIGGGPIGVIATQPMSAHQAAVVADWGDVTLFTNGMPEPDEATLDLLAQRSVRLQPGTVIAIDGAPDAPAQVRLANGTSVEVKALFIAPELHIRGTLAQDLGCALDDSPAGKIIATNAMKATTVAGVFAAGDNARAFGNITLSSADGVMAGLGVHQSLMFPVAHS
ncbi:MULTISPECIES: NAD(P)/FAD-dependent oxidoreductase [unclassified Rhizobium]|uniref:NAD(P)/FAD-dependent oxidoreductase n=1 Tax=unclassified Rhizobium TaxID=2613769 RepID=UPI000713F4F9|nr:MULTISPECIES: NAD(P)/FAD-dependent oxidoreductase [unclassified Rhizobium]KQS93829.1 thioredoxin reductase [Rhizobium sp. Leaf386]KQT06655.1 thioredoxin reductase [Rhizobium sp. Leaf391]KQU05084.1 thioredoxin reductase [Rhizobium sp. Leaf453]